MDRKLRNELIKLQTWLEDAPRFQRLIKEILAEGEEVSLPDRVVIQPMLATDEVDALLNELKQLSRDQAKKRLESMNKKLIESLFRRLMGKGSSSETKKSKEYVIDRILRRLFDVSREQDILLKG